MEVRSVLSNDCPVRLIGHNKPKQRFPVDTSVFGVVATGTAVVSEREVGFAVGTADWASVATTAPPTSVPNALANGRIFVALDFICSLSVQKLTRYGEVSLPLSGCHVKHT